MRLLYAAIFVILILNSVHAAEITQEQALDAVLRAENDIKEMDEAGFGTVHVRDLFLEAQDAFRGINLTKVLEEAKNITDTQ